MTENDMRKQKGMEIATSKELTLTPRGWIVPSQSGSGVYLVYKENGKNACTCKDYELRGCTCKHQYAVDFFVQKTMDAQGNTTITKTMRMTYPQNWSAYNEAQSNELRLFDVLLRDLVQGIEEPTQTFGRPRLPIKESVFCAIEKVYSQLSQRRATTLYRNAEERKQISHAPHFNVIGMALNRQDVTPILNRLLAVSALPLRSVEDTFAADSTGFSTSKFGMYAVEKYGIMRKHKWIKAHALVGTRTNVIASARILEEHSADCPQFKPMVLEAHNSGFNIRELVADKAYASRENYETAHKIGAQAYIPFKSNTSGKAVGSLIWKKMFHYFQMNREEFMEHYHKRSNVETTFDMVKMKFGDRLKSKNFAAQQNELLCKLIAHNIVVLIHEMYELGIKPEFLSKDVIGCT